MRTRTIEADTTQYLRHAVPATGSESTGCICPPAAFAPCGGRYEGRYAEQCPCRRAEVTYHYPATCPSRA